MTRMRRGAKPLVVALGVAAHEGATSTSAEPATDVLRVLRVVALLLDG